MLIDDASEPDSYLYYVPETASRLIKLFSWRASAEMSSVRELINVIAKFKPVRNVCEHVRKERLVEELLALNIDFEKEPLKNATLNDEINTLCDVVYLRVSNALHTVKDETGCIRVGVDPCGLDLHLGKHAKTYNGKILLFNESPIAKLLSMCSDCEIEGPPKSNEKVSGDSVVKFGNTLLVSLGDSSNVNGALWLGKRTGAESMVLVVHDSNSLRSWLKVIDEESVAIVSDAGRIARAVILERNRNGEFVEKRKVSLEEFLKSTGAKVVPFNGADARGVVRVSKNVFIVGSNATGFEPVLKNLGYNYMSLSVAVSEDYLLANPKK
ncbi:MAG: hypothetical protein ACP5HQ_02650 [Thermoprotei archaeon]